MPRIIFANKMDKTGADFYMCVSDIKVKLGAKPVPLQLPIGAESSFKGVVDLLTMKALVWEGDDKGAKFHEEEIPADSAGKAAEFRAEMIEAAVEMDDEAMAAYLDGKEPDVETLKRLIRKATVTRAFYPMLCGSAFKNKGVQPLLDAVVDYLPSPADREAFEAIDVKTGEPTVRRPIDTEPLSMLAFKIMDDPHVGSITFCRVYSGTVKSGMALANTTRDRKERVGRMYLMHADEREQIDEGYAGDIIALAGLKDTRTGETLSDPNKPVLLEKMEFPNPVIEMKIEPKTKADVEKMGIALQKLAAEDPSFRVTTDQESGETIIKGMGELHLDIKVDILKRTHKVEVNVGAPQVAYRETIARAAEIDYTHKKQTGGTGQFARVKLRFEPNEPGKGNEFETEIVGGAVPKEYIPGVEKGVQSRLGQRRPDRLPDGRHEGDAVRRRLPRGGLQHDRLRDRGPQCHARGRRQGRRQAARADHGRGGGDARRFRRQRHRRHQQPARPDPHPGDARQRHRDPRQRAARQHVRLREPAAVHEPGARHVHHAVRPLRGGAAQRGRRGQGEIRLSIDVGCLAGEAR